MKKILVTGTGRCGTTFLMRLFTHLNLDTGIKPDQINKHIFDPCNSGIELKPDSNAYIVKSPTFSREIKKIIEQRKWEIDFVIVPIRNYKEAAKSREHFKKRAGGLVWGATDFESQIKEFYKSMSILIQDITRYDLKTIFLDFEKMTTNKRYAYDKLKPMLSNINFESFCKAYQIADSDSKKKSGKWRKI